ncbi:Oidioi.mRNA.OKI2018_I69.YSR.g17064.t1.cds [Oikopleura dioica]|uniref:Oidioi.mRNA.OKI2018_I69.YSR.g17064.t1.cds n=1 Tax=Oikopleura dioica TaxID=34765 RepID=A0ABN7SQC7_OIKDI|nr:Oidioi.mRNA.OKI2018_I69.YSR.g17064.t1.cds [Oikopleura dioica]
MIVIQKMKTKDLSKIFEDEHGKRMASTTYKRWRREGPDLLKEYANGTRVTKKICRPKYKQKDEIKEKFQEVVIQELKKSQVDGLVSVKVRESVQADCGYPESGIIGKEKNFFDLEPSDNSMKTISEHCETAFRVFDDILLDMIGADLLFTDAYAEKLDEMVNQRRVNTLKKRTARSTQSAKRNTSRKKRAVGVAAAAGVTVAATGISLAYTGYVDAKSKQRDQELQFQIDDSRRAISELSESFELNTEMIGELAKQLKKSQSPIIVRGGIEISTDQIMQKDVLDGNPQSTIEYFAAYSSNYGKEMNIFRPLEIEPQVSASSQCLTYAKFFASSGSKAGKSSIEEYNAFAEWF